MSNFVRSYSEYLGQRSCCDLRGPGPVGPQGPQGPPGVRGQYGFTGPTGASSIPTQWVNLPLNGGIQYSSLISLTGLPVFSGNTDAIEGGLTFGYVYRDYNGILRIVF
uniref:Uncharacterized protein n=1 Tax=viral metagenome TaxID=1070528 RepID=A0A6C0IFM6_9ZZZZ